MSKEAHRVSESSSWHDVLDTKLKAKCVLRRHIIYVLYLTNVPSNQEYKWPNHNS